MRTPTSAMHQSAPEKVLFDAYTDESTTQHECVASKGCEGCRETCEWVEDFGRIA